MECGPEALTPVKWLGLENLLSAVSSALTMHGQVRGNEQLKALVRDTALDVTAMLTILGLRADIGEATVDLPGSGRVRIAFINLIDCDCSLTPQQNGVVRVNCTCPDGKQVTYNVHTACATAPHASKD